MMSAWVSAYLLGLATPFLVVLVMFVALVVWDGLCWLGRHLRACWVFGAYQSCFECGRTLFVLTGAARTYGPPPRKRKSRDIKDWPIYCRSCLPEFSVYTARHWKRAA